MNSPISRKPRTPRRHGLAFSILVLVSGCSLARSEDLPDDDTGAEEASGELAVPGDWVLPPEVRAAGQEQYVRRDDPLPWDNGANCGGSLLSGTKKLGEFLVAKFPAIKSADGYVCRPNTRLPDMTSVHGTGRALDLMLPLDGESADNGIGDLIANWLVMNAENIGVQFIIWDRTEWEAQREGEKAVHYVGPHPHHDHIHVELNEDGAAERTRFFKNLSRP